MDWLVEREWEKGEEGEGERGEEGEGKRRGGRGVGVGDRSQGRNGGKITGDVARCAVNVEIRVFSTNKNKHKQDEGSCAQALYV